MKTLLIFTLLNLITLSCFAPPTAPLTKEQLFEIQKMRIIQENEKNLNIFLDSLAYSETRDSTFYPYMGFSSPWLIVNSIGASGRFQLTDIALKDIGYKGTKKQFLHSRKIQKECAIKYLKKIMVYIKYYIPNYKELIGKKVRGVEFSLSGMIAASYLCGVGGLKAFIKTGYNSFDGGMTCRDYLSKFNKFELIINSSEA